MDSNHAVLNLWKLRSRHLFHFFFLDEFLLVPPPLLIFVMVMVDQDGLTWLVLLYGVIIHADCGSIGVFLLLLLLVRLTFVA